MARRRLASWRSTVDGQRTALSDQTSQAMVSAGLDPMRSWPVQDAKARFSELLDACLKEGPQLVTRRGERAAVLVPVEDWECLNRTRASHPEGVAADGRRAWRAQHSAAPEIV